MAAATATPHRIARPVLYAGAGAIALAIAMFWAMASLIAGGKYEPPIDGDLTPIDFLLRPPPPPVDNTRKPPEAPKPLEQPQRPKIDPQTQPIDRQAPTPVPMPKFEGSTTGGVYFDPGTGTGSRDGVLIPMVRVLPQYPRDASRDGITGFVVFEVVVNPDGTVKSARPIKAQPRGVFEAAATTAILRWKFRPQVVDGKAVESRGTQQIDFSLDAGN